MRDLEIGDLATSLAWMSRQQTPPDFASRPFEHAQTRLDFPRSIGPYHGVTRVSS
jgi:hypothetical protein